MESGLSQQGHLSPKENSRRRKRKGRRGSAMRFDFLRMRGRPPSFKLAGCLVLGEAVLQAPPRTGAKVDHSFHQNFLDYFDIYFTNFTRFVKGGMKIKPQVARRSRVEAAPDSIRRKS